ncbi:hypothetical protein H6775_03420 [Candidatus Nomurabacteria bacterium]|nr:hypothetical protein [Candidatus Nomurabacteria bacterium]
MKFQGREYSTITDQIPSKKYSLDNFLVDCLSQDNALDPGEIELYEKRLLTPIYEEYAGLFELIEEDVDIASEQKERIKSQLNKLMGLFQDISVRDPKDIILSLQSQKYGKDWPDQFFQERFDPLVDMIIRKFTDSIKNLEDQN